MGKVARVYLDDIGDKLAKENIKFRVENRGERNGVLLKCHIKKEKANHLVFLCVNS